MKKRERMSLVAKNNYKFEKRKKELAKKKKKEEKQQRRRDRGIADNETGPDEDRPVEDGD